MTMQEKGSAKVHQLSVSAMLAEVIRRLHKKESLLALEDVVSKH